EKDDARAQLRCRARLESERALPRERPRGGEERHEARNEVVGALGDLEALLLEEQDFLEVFLQAARSVEVALERFRRRRAGIRNAVFRAIDNLVPERLGEAFLELRGHGHESFRVRALRLDDVGERTLRTGEHLEETNAHVFVDEPALARELGGFVRVGPRKALS